jgi:hypothetical protein
MPPTIARFHQPGLSAHAQRPPQSGSVQVPFEEVTRPGWQLVLTIRQSGFHRFHFIAGIPQ